MDKLCILVRELLPLHEADACSLAAAAAVEEHLQQCEECRCRWEQLHAVLPGEEAAASRGMEELKPAAPLARLWRRALLRAAAWVAAVLLGVVALLLTVCTLRGDGFTWFSLPAYITAEKLADAVVDENPIRMRKYIAFTGVGPQDELEIRQKLQALALEDGVHLSEGRSSFSRCAADDGIQELSVFFTVWHEGKSYTAEFPGSLWEPFGGKAALRYPLVKDNSTGRYVEPLWLDALADALCTHNPG